MCIDLWIVLYVVRTVLTATCKARRQTNQIYAYSCEVLVSVCSTTRCPSLHDNNVKTDRCVQQNVYN